MLKGRRPLLGRGEAVLFGASGEPGESQENPVPWPGEGLTGKRLHVLNV